MIFVKRNLPNLEVSVAKKKKKKIDLDFLEKWGRKKRLNNITLIIRLRSLKKSIISIRNKFIT